MVTQITKELADALTRSQNQYEGRLTEVDQNIETLTREASRRRKTAVWLKVLIVVCGIMVASGLLQNSIVQATGIVILIITALERIFANVDRLIAVTTATSALNRIRRSTVNLHEASILRIIKIRDSQPIEAAESEADLNERLRTQLAEKLDEVKSGLDSKNLELLGRLVLEEKE